MKKRHRIFSREFKAEIVEDIEQGKLYHERTFLSFITFLFTVL